MNVIRRVVAVVAITMIASSVYAQPQSAQHTRQLRRITPREGQRVSVVLKDGQRVTGTVGTVFSRGFDVHQLNGTPVFVQYRSVAVLLDPDTGAIVGTVTGESLSRREKGVLITIATVAGLAIATHGMIPGCLFQRCLM